VIDHVIKWLDSQRDPQVIHVREVGGTQLTGPVDLVENVLERIFPGPPGSGGQRFTQQAISMPVLSS